MPFASLARVLPVHGAITSASKNFLGPIGSASGIVYIPFLPAIFSMSEIKSDALPKRLSNEQTFGEKIGYIL